MIPPGFVCIDGLLATAPPPPVETPPADPPVSTEPAPDPPPPVDPPPAVPPPVDPAPGPEIPVVVPAPGDPLPGPVDLPGSGPSAGGGSGSPSIPGGSLSDGAKGADGATSPGTTISASARKLDPASTTKSLLTAATVSNLASSDLPTLSAIRSLQVAPGTAGLPLSAYTPSPLFANMPATAAIAAVQAPLLAVGDDAAAGGGFTLAGLSSKALPGLLVVLGTALVAAVGAGNLRYWQDRLDAWRH